MLEANPVSHAKESDSSSHRLLNMVQWIKQQEVIGCHLQGKFRWSHVWAQTWLDGSMMLKEEERRGIGDHENRSLEEFCLRDKGKKIGSIWRGEIELRAFCCCCL